MEIMLNILTLTNPVKVTRNNLSLTENNRDEKLPTIERSCLMVFYVDVTSLQVDSYI